MRQSLSSFLGVSLIGGWIVASPATAQPAFSSTIEVKHKALAKLLEDPNQPDKRKYLRGHAGDSCDWIYVNQVEVTTSKDQRLSLRAHLRAKLPLSACQELGDIPVEVVASPVYRDNVVTLENPKAVLGGAQSGLLDTVINSLLAKVRLNPRERLAPLLANGQSADGLKFELPAFEVKNPPRLEKDGTRFTVVFGLSIQ